MDGWMGKPSDRMDERANDEMNELNEQVSERLQRQHLGGRFSKISLMQQHQLVHQHLLLCDPWQSKVADLQCTPHHWLYR